MHSVVTVTFADQEYSLTLTGSCQSYHVAKAESASTLST